MGGVSINFDYPVRVEHFGGVSNRLFDSHRESPFVFSVPVRPVGPHDADLITATRAAVKAAGGLKVCSAETGLSPSHLSRCETLHNRDSVTVRDAVAIDALALARRGVAPILAAQARAHRFVLVPLPDGDADADGMMACVLELTTELGDVAGSIRDALRDRDFTPDEARDAMRELDDLDRASATLRLKLETVARGKLEPVD